MTLIDATEVDRRLAYGDTLPSELYTDPRYFAIEQELVFRRSWGFVGLERDLAKTGDYITGIIAGVPIVVVRDEQAALRAFVNVCRHRANVVAEGRGNQKSLRCRYHGWTYSLSGEFLAAPRFEEAGLAACNAGLLPVAVDTFAGLVFVSLEPHESLASFLGELPDVMQETGYDFPFTGSAVVFRRRLEFQFECNWKVSIENSLECYHCPTVHTRTFNDMYRTDREGYLYRNFDRGCYHAFWLKERQARRLGLASDRSPDLTIYFPWPTVGLSSIKQLIPDGPDRCTLTLDIYGPEESPRSGHDTDSMVDEFASASSATFEEDRAVCAAVQRGLGSQAIRFGRTLAETETNIRHFQKLTWAAIRPAFDGRVESPLVHAATIA
jgi:phenylpropionate dioxygenase-like ring-hydroxylating dioxygenase large terminal subunit